MKLRTFAIVLALVLIALFAWLNWTAFTAPTALSLGVAQVQAPLGLVMLVITAAVCALFLIWVAIEQARSIVQARRHAREVQALREQVEQAEASRLNELREFVAQGLRSLETRQDAGARGIQDRIAQLENEQRRLIDEATRTLSAYIGEVEDKLDRRLGTTPD